MRLLAAALIVVGLAGCGSTSPEDQFKDAVLQHAADGRAGKWGDYCTMTTDPNRCAGLVATLQATGTDPASLIPSAENVDLKVQVDGDRATVNGTAGKDAEYVRRDGQWLQVWPTG